LTFAPFFNRFLDAGVCDRTRFFFFLVETA
jgi:hypothetical protein